MALWLPALARLRRAMRLSTRTVSWATRKITTMAKALKMLMVIAGHDGSSVQFRTIETTA